jgi:CRP/FNR family transcriptional regulator, dissimilatory nitrate respiration regulator
MDGPLERLIGTMDQTATRVTPGSTFAEALMFLRRPHYPVSATAIGAVDLVSLDAVDFHAMLAGSVGTCLFLLGDMSRRLRGLIGEIDDLSLHSATCRVAAYLARRAQREGSAFNLGVPKQVIASRLSVQPETLSRTLRSLGDAGVIRVEGGRLEVLDRQALEVASGE